MATVLINQIACVVLWALIFLTSPSCRSSTLSSPCRKTPWYSRWRSRISVWTGWDWWWGCATWETSSDSHQWVTGCQIAWLCYLRFVWSEVKLFIHWKLWNNNNNNNGDLWRNLKPSDSYINKHKEIKERPLYPPLVMDLIINCYGIMNIS